MNQCQYMVKCKICNKSFLRISPTHLKTHNTTMSEYILKYKCTTEDITSSITRSKVGITLDKCIKRYGEIIGKRKWGDYIEKQKYSNSFEYKQKKNGWSKEVFDEYNKSRSSTKYNFIKRYGEVIGCRKWDEYRKLQQYAGSSKEYFIDKYGPIIGPKKWYELCNKKKHNLTNYIQRYGEKDGNTKWLQYLKKKTQRYSNISQELFEILQNRLADHDLSFFKKYNSEYFFYFKEDKKYVFVDLYDKTTNKCIEFFGDYWHANPLIYNKNFRPHGGKSAEEIWVIDRDRLKKLKEYFNIDTIIIWESEYVIDSKAVVDRCMRFLCEDNII